MSRGLYNKHGLRGRIWDPQSVVKVGQKQVFCIPNENSHEAHTHYYVSLAHSTSTDIRLLKIMDCYNKVKLLPGITDMKRFIALELKLNLTMLSSLRCARAETQSTSLSTSLTKRHIQLEFPATLITFTTCLYVHDTYDVSSSWLTNHKKCLAAKALAINVIFSILYWYCFMWISWRDHCICSCVFYIGSMFQNVLSVFAV